MTSPRMKERVFRAAMAWIDYTANSLSWHADKSGKLLNELIKACAAAAKEKKHGPHR